MKKTNTSKSLLLEQLRKTPIVQIVCEKSSISRASFYRWKAEDPEFAKAADEATLEGYLLVNDLAESQLIGAVKDRNLTAIMYWLKHHHADYKNRLEIEGTINTIQELNPEQKELVKQALKLSGISTQSYENQEETK